MRSICIQYELPHPIHLLQNPIPKEKFKQLSKLKVFEFWHQKLSKEAALPSLQYLHPGSLSLSNTHPIFASLDGNPYQSKAARVQALLLSGRYRTERLCRFWSHNKEGFCLLPTCKDEKIYEDIEHIFLRCSGLSEARRRVNTFTSDFISDKPILKHLVNEYLYSAEEYPRMQFIIDPSVLPMVITATQLHGNIIHEHLFKISRTWCRSLHVARLKALGRYNKI